MILPSESTVTSLMLTTQAADAVREIMLEKNLQGYALRLFISGGGCSGYQYGLALDNRFREEDTVIETDGIKLVVDEVSIKYLSGASIDYVNEGDEIGFKIVNPNPISTCSCNQGTPQDDISGGCSGCG